MNLVRGRHGPEAKRALEKDRTIPTFSRGELPHFAGINTFLKAPYVEDVHLCGDYDVTVPGCPHDGGAKVCREHETTTMTVNDCVGMGIDKAAEIAPEVAWDGAEAVWPLDVAAPGY